MDVNILGIRGIPAAHGGFESFVEILAPYLRDKGYGVNVYCQADHGDKYKWMDEWNGIRRIHIRPKLKGPLGTIEFDFACVWDVLSREGVDLVLGYNTAVFCLLQRLWGRKVVINMDGVEWKRAKWGIAAKAWFWINEMIASNVSSVAVADHPEIVKHVKKRSLKHPVMIPYGAVPVSEANPELLEPFELTADNYFVSIARIEPENSILELVRGFSKLRTKTKLLVLGSLSETNAYHREVRSAANGQVIFPGAIYDKQTVAALRANALAYLHGHQVGGTNPSLVEALAAGSVVLAHDNKYNRWTAGSEQYYFSCEEDIASIMNDLLNASDDLLLEKRRAAKALFYERFQWEGVLESYESVLVSQLRLKQKA